MNIVLPGAWVLLVAVVARAPSSRPRDAWPAGPPRTVRRAGYAARRAACWRTGDVTDSGTDILDITLETGTDAIELGTVDMPSDADSGIETGADVRPPRRAWTPDPTCRSISSVERA